jgi:hypothetical protein
MTEHAEQVAVIDWCFAMTRIHPGLDLIFAIPNGAMLGGGRVGAIRANSLKAEGMRPGVCDLFLPVVRGKWHGMFIEMKTTIGKLSENQEEFIAGVEAQGYFTAVCYGADEAIEQLTFYLQQNAASVRV